MYWILFNEEERETVLSYNEGTEFQIIPRMIDREEYKYQGYVVSTRVDKGSYKEYWDDKLEGYTRFKAEPDELFVPPEY